MISKLLIFRWAYASNALRHAGRFANALGLGAEQAGPEPLVLLTAAPESGAHMLTEGVPVVTPRGKSTITTRAHHATRRRT